jgi:hypothetical protein
MEKVRPVRYATIKQFLLRCPLVVSLVLPVDAQTTDAATKQKLTDAAKQGFDLQANLDVADNVTVEAVLLPERVCREVFGKEISRNYATIELTISNHSRDASLIVQSLFIDYGGWALSGLRPAREDHSDKATQTTTQTEQTERTKTHYGQATTQKNQIASVEYRIVRGQMLDRQPWTRRNAVVHALQLAGTIASAYVFTTTDVDIVRGVNGFNGQVLPALQTFWPDTTIGQMNRISDVGFQVNKVVPKDSSDIIVAFFPIDRFLTPGLKRLFLKSPALFFAPRALVFDVQARKQLEPLIRSFFNNDTHATNEFMATLPEKFASPQNMDQHSADILTLLDSVSLNNVAVLVGGIMTVDVNTVPGDIVSIELDGGNDNPKNWTEGDHLGAIQGSYLLNGTPELVGAPTGVQVVAVQDGSTASTLRFKLTLPANFLTAQEQKLIFKVTKSGKNGKGVDSMNYEMAVPTASSDAPKHDNSAAKPPEHRQ